MQLGLAFPKECLNSETLRPFMTGEERDECPLTVDKAGDRWVLWWNWQHEGGWGWTEGEGNIDQLVGIRDEIMRGDYRALFLGWLADFELEWWLDPNYEGTIPPIPADLDNLSTSLSALIEHFPVDADVLAAAAKLSQSTTRKRIPIDTVIKKLSEPQMREMLHRVAQGEGTTVMSELNRQTYPVPETPATPEITCTEFAERALLLRKARLKREAKEADAKKKRERKERQLHLASLLKRADSIWAELDGIMEQKIASAYDRAATQLRDAYDQAQESTPFQNKLKAFRRRYARRPAMIRRIEDL